MADSLKTRIFETIKDTMKSKDMQKLGALRLISAAIKQKEVDERIDLTDADVLQVLEKMLKQRRDSLEQYQKANRQDLAAQEQFEIELIQTFMPEQLSPDELSKLIKDAILSSGAKDIKDMGKVMGILKPRIQGRADMRTLGELIKQQLS